MSEYKTDILIIGSGPAGYTAAIYTIRSGKSTTLITGYQTGGQLTTTTEIENFPGFPKPILGGELMDRMSNQCINLGVKLVVDNVKKVDFSTKPLIVETDKGDIYKANAIIIATGASAKRANILGEEKFWGFGVSTCATCDGFFYRNKDVIIVGGGNAALVEALHLSHIANSVSIIHRRDEFRAENIMIERVKSNPKIKIYWDSVVEEIYGEETPKSVTGVKVKNLKTNELIDIKASGIFIAIGHQPNTHIFEGQIDLDEAGYIITQKKSTQTSVEGVFAAGDVTNPRYKQAIIAAANGCEASLDAIEFLDK